MTISVYEVTIPVFQRGLLTLSRLLEKAAAQAERRGYPAELLLHSRFYPDMYPLSQQINRVCQIPLETASYLSRYTPAVLTTDLQTLPGCQQLVLQTSEQLQQFKPEHFVAALVQPLQVQIGQQPVHFIDGLQFALQHSVPNFYFHLTTAYNLLRHNGVDLGKLDYLGHERR